MNESRRITIRFFEALVVLLVLGVTASLFGRHRVAAIAGGLAWLSLAYIGIKRHYPRKGLAELGSAPWLYWVNFAFFFVLALVPLYVIITPLLYNHW